MVRYGTPSQCPGCMAASVHVGYVFQHLRAFVVNLAPNAGIREGDLPGCGALCCGRRAR